MISHSVEMKRSFICTNGRLPRHFDFPPSPDLWLRFPFPNCVLPCPSPSTPTRSRTFALFTAYGHRSCLDLVISWPSSQSRVLSLHHKSRPWVLQSFLLLFSKLSPICLHVYDSESPELHSLFSARSHQKHTEGPGPPLRVKWPQLLFPAPSGHKCVSHPHLRQSLQDGSCLDFSLAVPIPLTALLS